jgi:WD40 repeat protein
MFIPECIYTSKNYSNTFLKFAKYISNDVLTITDDNYITISNGLFNVKENNFIYDYDILYETNDYTGEYLKLIFTCSKDNPVRVYNHNGDIVDSYVFKNHLEEITNPISLRIDEYGMNVLCGFNNYYTKIDLVSDRISKYQNVNGLVSCFDFNYLTDYYLLGTYSRSIYLVDYKTDKPFKVINRHRGGINCLLFLNSINFVSSARKDDEVMLWDSRKIDEPVYTFYRNNPTNQKINICSKDDDLLFLSNYDGSLMVYDLKKFELVSYFYTNEYKETVSCMDYHEGRLLTSTGRRHFTSNEEDSEPDEMIESVYRIWKSDIFM